MNTTNDRINKTKLPEYFHYQVSDQLDLLMMQRTELPFVAVKLMIKNGAANDPPGKEGLNRLTARMLKKGAGKYSADEFAEVLDYYGANLNIHTNYDFINLDGEFLSRDIDKALELISSMLIAPRFDEKEIRLLKKNTIGEISSYQDEPSFLCEILHNRNIFRQHPYGRSIIGSQKTIHGIKARDIKTNHTRNILKSKMLLTIVGDININKTTKKVEKGFSGLNIDVAGSNGFLPPPEIKNRHLFVADKKGQEQAHLRIGRSGIARNDIDFHKLIVANTYFGGSFTSRLMTEVRVKRGLTYGIRSAISANVHPGHVTVITYTKNETASEAIEIIFREIQRMQTKRISPKDLEGTKKYLAGLYPLSLETNKRLANKLADIYFYGLPVDTYDEYVSKIREVNATDILNVAARFYSDSNVVVTALGNEKVIKNDLKKLGKIIRQDVKDAFELPGP